MKKLLSLLMALMICLGVFTLVGGVHTVKAAEDDIASGTSGTCSWVIDKDGVFTIRPTDGVSGKMGSWSGSVGYSPWYQKRSQVTKIVIEKGVIGAPSMPGLFYEMSNCEEIVGLENLDTSNMTRMDFMFSNCSKLTSIDVSSFDTSNVVDMTGMFRDCSSLVELDLSLLDTTNVTNIGRFLSGCTKLKRLDISGLDLSNVISYYSTYENLNSLQEIKLGKSPFRGKNNVTILFNPPVPSGECYTGKWIHKDKVYGPYTSTQLRDNYTSEMEGTWVWELKPCAILSDDGTLSFIRPTYDSVYTPNSIGTVKSISGGEYSGRIYLVNETSTSSNRTWTSIASQVRKVNFVDEIKPRSTYSWFADFSNCTEMDITKLNTSDVISMGLMFDNCAALTSLDVSNFDVSNVTNLANVFRGCSKLKFLDVSRWNTSKVTTMNGVFNKCYELDGIDVSKWDVSKTTTLAYVFCDCIGLKSIDVSHWNTTSCKDMNHLFTNCHQLKTLDLKSFDTSKVTTFDAFLWMNDWYDPQLTSLDLSTWDTHVCSNFTGMFYNLKNLEFLDISGFNTQNSNRLGKMFDLCSSLKKVNLGDEYRFNGNNYSGGVAKAILPTPSSNAPFTGKWIREDKAYGPYTPAELRDNYTPVMAGTWVWELAPVEYRLSFEAGENGTGSMAPVNAPAKEDFTLPANQFVAFGYEFDHWDDGNRHTYSDEATIPANTYAADTKVTLTAVWKKRDTSLNWNGNEATFSIRAGEQAVLDNIPAGTSYQVYELTPDGWVLVQQENSSGVIEALEESAAAFWNKYQPGVTTVQFSGLKNLDGRPAEAGKFTFELYEGDTLVDTATTQDGGFIQFKVIEYDAAGDHVYTIREVDPNDDTIDYDMHEETVEVSVTDNGNGTLSSEVTYDNDGIVFSNATRPGTLRITKDAINGTSANANDEFTIEIEFRNESGMPINDNVYWYVEGEAMTPSEISGGNQE